jgi:hypothetical protein
MEKQAALTRTAALPNDGSGLERRRYGLRASKNWGHEGQSALPRSNAVFGDLGKNLTQRGVGADIEPIGVDVADRGRLDKPAADLAVLREYLAMSVEAGLAFANEPAGVPRFTAR